MAIKKTGHAEIDQQHFIIESMVEELSNYYAGIDHYSNFSCQECKLEGRKICADPIRSLAEDMRAFLIGHNVYEEKMMELLPDTPVCQAHINAHKLAHMGISKNLKMLSKKMDSECPRAIGFKMFKIAGDWLGDHSLAFDAGLVRHIDNIENSEIDFDEELVAILDKYVFPDRPTQKKSSYYTELAIQRKRMEVRGRFESLSPAQCKVFWLVASGKKNKEIASELGCSVNTIKTHRAAIFSKLEVKSVLDLVKKADLLR